MDKDHFLSLEFSKRLRDNGCTLETPYYWCNYWDVNGRHYPDYGQYVYHEDRIKKYKAQKHVIVPTYSFKDVTFGKYRDEFCAVNGDPLWVARCCLDSHIVHTNALNYGTEEDHIMVNNLEKRYIWKSCIFNPKNKKLNLS